MSNPYKSNSKSTIFNISNCTYYYRYKEIIKKLEGCHYGFLEYQIVRQEGETSCALMSAGARVM